MSQLSPIILFLSLLGLKRNVFKPVDMCAYYLLMLHTKEKKNIQHGEEKYTYTSHRTSLRTQTNDERIASPSLREI